MSTQADRLKLKDVRRIFRILAEMRCRGDDPAVWRPYMAKQLLSFFAAELVISTEIYVRKTSSGDAWDVTDIGWGCDANHSEWRIESTTRETHPQAFNFTVNDTALPAEDNSLAIEPSEQIHRGSTFMISSIKMAHISAIDQLGVHRAHGIPKFNANDHKLLRLLHLELARFWKADVLRQTRDPNQSLAPRLKQTLGLLCEGKSEKEIANAIGISPHTVHNYVKALHQRFEVASRGELIAAANKRQHDFVPRLSVEVFPTKVKKKKKPRETTRRRLSTEPTAKPD